MQTSFVRGLISIHSSLSNETGWFTMPRCLLLCFTSVGHNGFIDHIVYCRWPNTVTRRPLMSNSVCCILKQYVAWFRMDVVEASISQEPPVLSINSSLKIKWCPGREKAPIFNVCHICVCVLLTKWLNWVSDGWNWLFFCFLQVLHATNYIITHKHISHMRLFSLPHICTPSHPFHISTNLPQHV